MGRLRSEGPGPCDVSPQVWVSGQVSGGGNSGGIRDVREETAKSVEGVGCRERTGNTRHKVSVHTRLLISDTGWGDVDR